MKKAIGYIRISTKDQSNFSLSGQEKYIREYASQHSIEISSLFTDEGKSAKNFDRPDWKLLEKFIEKHHRDIDYLIVAKYDRFSRNAAQGLSKIELLERKFKIIIVSVFEQMFIDYDSPFFFKQRADMLISAEFEWHVIRDRTRFGNHNARSQGRYLGVAPFGYKNARDEQNKPILVMDEAKANIIKNIYAGFLRGTSFTELSKAARSEGLTNSGRSAIQRILTNPVYGGLIFVAAYKKEAAKYVKSIHQGIVAEHTWWQVQQLMNKGKVRTIINDEVPMRSVLHCHCGHPLTAGNSKGKTKYYWYYKCNKHPETSYSAVTLHNQFDELLSNLSLSKVHIDFLREDARKEMELQLQNRDAELKELKKELHTNTTNMLSLEEKFITGIIQSDTYNRWHSKYSATESHLRYRIESLTGDNQLAWKLFDKELPKLSDMRLLYSWATVPQKQTFIRMVFNSQLRYEEGVYRTPYLLPFFSLNTASLKEKRLLEVEQPEEEFGKIVGSTPTGTSIELSTQFLSLIAQIKAA